MAYLCLCPPIDPPMCVRASIADGGVPRCATADEVVARIRAAGWEVVAPIRAEKARRRYLTPEERRQLIEEYKAGVTPKPLATKYGLQVPSVLQIVRRAGVPRQISLSAEAVERLRANMQKNRERARLRRVQEKELASREAATDARPASPRGNV